MRKISALRKRLHREYAAKRPVSWQLIQEAENLMPGGDTRTATYFQPFPHFIERGQGCYLWDADGNKLIDFVNNYSALVHGHAYPPLLRSLGEQVKNGTVYAAPAPLVNDYARLLCDRCPSIDLIRFTSSGSEASMQAVRCARAFTGRSLIVKMEGGYHGNSDIFEASVDPLLREAGPLHAPRPVPDSKGVPEDSLKQVIIVPFNDRRVLERVYQDHPDEIAALIVEPLMASAGMVEPEEGYLAFLREITRRNQSMLIFDEVTTFRLSPGGAQEYYDVMPDLTVLGKIIGGGLPMGAFGGRRQIMEMYDPRMRQMYHSGANNANLLAVRAGLVTMQGLDGTAIASLNALGELFRLRCRDVFAELGLNIQVIGAGSFANIVFTSVPITEYRGIATSYEEFNILLNLALLNKGVFNAPRGMFCVSTAMTENEINFAITAIRRCLYEMMPAITEEAPDLILPK